MTRYLAAAIWATGTTLALVTPGDSFEQVGGWLDLPEWLEPWIDKLIHFGLFLVLTLLVGRCFEDDHGEIGTPRMAFGVTMLYVVLLEIAQLWVPGRSFEPLDVVAGLLGVLLGVRLHYRARIAREA